MGYEDKDLCAAARGRHGVQPGILRAPEQDETSSTAQSPTPAETEEKAADKNGDIYILFTSDVHCGVNQGFGYAGLERVKDTLEENGYETILVDDGDSIQGEAIGTLSKGEAIVDLMNEVGYDVAIPGNHEFDYGTERFLELVQKAEYPYISCNFTYLNESVLEPYVIKEAAGKKIAFVGVTTPRTMRGSTPAYFQNESGEYVYGFMQDDQTGAKIYQAIQNAVDAARAEGADYVYLIAHLGNEEECRPWTYADVIANTNGIDVVLDGHSHDMDQIVMLIVQDQTITHVICEAVQRPFPQCVVGIITGQVQAKERDHAVSYAGDPHRECKMNRQAFQYAEQENHHYE